MAIILASGSPRRQELLTKMGLEFEVRVPRVKEEYSLRDSPREIVWKLASQKAFAVAVEATPDDVIIAADTIVVLDGRVMVKPKDAADAKRMLRALSGKSHRVLTAFTVIRGVENHTRVDETQVVFRNLSDREIDLYIATGEALDKAGAYAVQGEGAQLISAIHGDYYNVVGLPIGHLASMLHRFGVAVGL